jgi:predicted CoA-binding protein
MHNLQEKVDDFLAQKIIAVAGVSRESRGEAANHIYLKLKNSRYTVFSVNPNAGEVEGDTCYPDLKSLPQKPDGVVISTRPEVSGEVVRECADLGISRVWMHRSFGPGSVSEKATQFCQDNNIMVIAGACPMMYGKPVDFAHKVMHWLLRVLKKLPQ